MPWLMQMVWFFVMCIGIAVALWISFWVLLVIFGVGLIAVIWSHLKDYLLKKGILNPRPGVPLEEQGEEIVTPTITIEGDYKRVDSE